MSDTGLTRRELLAGAALVAGAAAAGRRPDDLGAQGAPIPPRPTGLPTADLGVRSPFEHPTRSPTGATLGSSYTPLQELAGTLTPSDLHFERHHAGIPAIDPDAHRLMIHGLVDRPLVFSVAELQRLPQVTRTYFVECSGNGRPAYRNPAASTTVQRLAGMMSNSEWTGVSLATLFREAGVRPDATWFLAEGADACLMTRSVPVEKAWDDALVVWAQNGEPLRPAQGYPLRLLLPGWEGNICVKWLRRLELGTKPWMTRWETAKYTDPLPGGKARQFSFVLDAKSVITSPSVPGTVASRGWHSINGLAWSGRGRITRVEVSVDGGASWADATFTGPALSKAAVRFERMWEWGGQETVLLSRATDETGYVQPTRSAFVAARGPGTDYHFNPITGWKVGADGAVSFHGDT